LQLSEVGCRRRMLQLKYGIKCPEGCRCFDPDRAKIVSKARDLDKLIFVSPLTPL